MKHVSPNSLIVAGAAAQAAAIFRGRTKTRDGLLTFDSAPVGFDQQGNNLGRSLPVRARSVDSAGRVNTYDSSGAFLLGELERLDQTLHMPLVDISWPRDIQLREDVTIADQFSGYTLSTFGSAGGLGTGNGNTNGIAWIGQETNQITTVSVDIAQITNPLKPWGVELKYTILDLESAARLGRPIDQQQYAAMQLKHQMDTDQLVYVGDSPSRTTGLVNSQYVTNVSNVANGALGTPGWQTKTPAEILQDVNEIIVSTWQASAYAVMPGKLLLPPPQFGYISTQLVSNAGNTSILKYLQDNSVLTTSGRGKLDIQPLKWLIGAGAGGTIGVSDGHDRMVAYTNEQIRVRFPMTLLQKTPLQFDSIFHKTTYFSRMGVLEVVYPQTLAYRDGL